MKKLHGRVSGLFNEYIWNKSIKAIANLLLSLSGLGCFSTILEVAFDGLDCVKVSSSSLNVASSTTSSSRDTEVAPLLELRDEERDLL